MSANTSIEWTDKTWNPVRGCSVISPGCVNCYAMKTAHRFNGEPNGKASTYYGLTKMTSAGPQWTGNIQTVEKALREPLKWRKPQRVFVNSMSDLFHEGVPDVFIDQVFAVMALAKRHTFQILTKRADRMREYCSRLPNRGCNQFVSLKGYGSTAVLWGHMDLQPWPLPNVWLGVSVEDQKHADERIPKLLTTPAVVRFVSAEPLLGPVWFHDFAHTPRIDWVIVGGESGHGARPFDVAWALSIVTQCKAADVPVFVKQLGRNPISTSDADHGLVELDDRKGGDIDEWPADLRVRQFPEMTSFALPPAERDWVKE